MDLIINHHGLLDRLSVSSSILGSLNTPGEEWLWSLFLLYCSGRAPKIFSSHRFFVHQLNKYIPDSLNSSSIQLSIDHQLKEIGSLNCPLIG
ncbi:hypothetical protein QVD17_31447 [Tagetes erecta]|uniref:Uncharacterized protein n=1 Tax=Tagetes erecta TaxID=13708 RepID=A0AAD8K7J1_TARER|nr:hypothetical protein QVD17_31447 [Tagetes erecta]